MQGNHWAKYSWIVGWESYTHWCPSYISFLSSIYQPQHYQYRLVLNLHSVPSYWFPLSFCTSLWYPNNILFLSTAFVHTSYYHTLVPNVAQFFYWLAPQPTLFPIHRFPNLHSVHSRRFPYLHSVPIRRFPSSTQEDCDHCHHYTERGPHHTGNDDDHHVLRQAPYPALLVIPTISRGTWNWHRGCSVCV